jgi:[ribosomal protein S5]-alanine N-acetyltransferase
MHIDCDTFVIDTPRLSLKPVSLAVKEDIFREFTHEITVYMTPVPAKHVSETESFINESRKNMKDGKELVLGILAKETEEFLGIVGLHKIDTVHPELGVWLKKSAHGQRYGREAVHAVKEWADRHVRYDYILYPVDRANVASRKIPEALGGMVHAEYTKSTPSGATLNTVEYRIYPPASTENDQ